MQKLNLLPVKFRAVGLGLAGVGLILAVVRFYFGFKPDILDVKVFALYSRYVDTKVFEVIHNQLLEEISGVLVMTGLVLAAFSKVKIENEQVNYLRLQSFVISGFLNALFFIIGILFTYGIGYVFVLMMNSISWLVFYLVLFSLRYNHYSKTKP